MAHQDEWTIRDGNAYRLAGDGYLLTAPVMENDRVDTDAACEAASSTA